MLATIIEQPKIFATLVEARRIYDESCSKLRHRNTAALHRLFCLGVV